VFIIKINFRQKIAILLAILVTTSDVSASNSKNSNCVNREKSSFLTESDGLVKKSYDEKKMEICFTF